MRKLLFILLALAGCLLFSEGSGDVHAREAVHSAVFSSSDMHVDQWQCERVYNSDLNQPRVSGEAEASPSGPTFQRTGPGWAARLALHCVASCHCGTGVVKLTSAFRSLYLSPGLHAVDYYVYRLRRLII